MQDSALYAVPAQVAFKRWPALAGPDPAALTRRLLLRNPSATEDALFLLVAPHSPRFSLHAAGFPRGGSTRTAFSHEEAVEVSYVTTAMNSGGIQGAVAFTLPPEGTLTCTISFHAPSGDGSSSGTNFQDAIFAYTPSCALGPALCVPLLALQGDEPPSAAVSRDAHATFSPARVVAPSAPAPSFWSNWLRRRAEAEEEALATAQRDAASAGADVFVLDQDGDGEDEEAEGPFDAMQDEHAPGDDQEESYGADAAMDDAGDSPRTRQSAETLNALGARIAAAAAHADAEEAAGASADSVPSASFRDGVSSSSSRRTALTSSAGVVREGFAARLHSSHGLRSARGSSGSGGVGASQGPLVPGQQHVFVPLARPATAEQRHLASRVDERFVAQTERAIDELLEDDVKEQEQEEEDMLRQSAMEAAAAAAEGSRLHQQQQQGLEFDAGSMMMSGAAASEQDEAEFYRQIMAAERAQAAALTSRTSAAATSGSGSTPARAPAARAPSSSPTGTARPRASAARQSPPPQATPSSSASASSRARGSPSASPSPSPPGSANRPQGSPTPRTLATSMQRLQLQQQPADAAAEWNDRLARAQETERRRYLEQNGAPMHQAGAGYAGGAPAMATASRPSTATALGGLKLPKIG